MRDLSSFLSEVSAFSKSRASELVFQENLRPISLNIEKAMRYITSIRVERKKKKTSPQPPPFDDFSNSLHLQ